MLNTSYTVGAGAYAYVFTKQFDTDTKAQYSVQGLSASAARTMSVSHQKQKNKVDRHLVDMTATYVVPGSTSGQTYDDRIYLVIQRSPYTTVTESKGNLATFLALAGTSAFQDAVLNNEL